MDLREKRSKAATKFIEGHVFDKVVEALGNWEDAFIFNGKKSVPDGLKMTLFFAPENKRASTIPGVVLVFFAPKSARIYRVTLDEEQIWPKTAEDFALSMKDPDDIGASEYRILYDLVDDISNSYDRADDGSMEPDSLDLVQASLDEVIGWAKSIKRDLKEFKRK